MAGGRRWWRAYAEAAHDPKLNALPGWLFKHWFRLMCLACSSEGALPAPAEVRRWLQLKTLAGAQRVLTELHGRTLLDLVDGRYTPHNWHGRQYVSDSSTERVQRFRNVSRNAARNGPEQSRADTEQKEREREARVARPHTNGQPRKGTTLPLDWQPTAQDVSYAIDHGLEDRRLDDEVERFRNYWTAKAGAGATKRDWHATWRNWVLNSKGRARPIDPRAGII